MCNQVKYCLQKHTIHGIQRWGSSAAVRVMSSTSTSKLWTGAINVWSADLLRDYVDKRTARTCAEISGASAGQHWQGAVSLLCQHMEATNHDVHPAIIAAVMSVLEESLQWQQSLLMVNDLLDGVDDGSAPCKYLLNTVLRTCNKARAWHFALQLLENSDALRDRLGVHLHDITHSSAVASDWVVALELLGGINRGSRKLTGVGSAHSKGSINLGSDLDTKAYRACQTVHRTVRLWQLLRALTHPSKLQSAGGDASTLMPDTVSFNACIAAAANSGQWRLALGTLRAAAEAALQPDLVGYTAAINACGQAQQWRISTLLFEEILSAGMKPDSVAWCALVNTAMWQHSLQIHRRMIDMGGNGSLEMYTSLVGACGRGHQWQMSLEFLQTARRQRLEVDILLNVASISACGKARRWEHGLAVLVADGRANPRMLARAIQVSAKGRQTHAVNRLLSYLYLQTRLLHHEDISAAEACATAQLWQAALKLHSMANTARTCRILSLAAASCATASLWRDACWLLHEMQSQGMRPADHVTNALVGGFAKALHWQRALQLSDEMLKQHVHVDAMAFDALTHGLITGSSWPMAIYLLGNEEDSGPVRPRESKHSNCNATARLVVWLLGQRLTRVAVAYMQQSGVQGQLIVDVAKEHKVLARSVWSVVPALDLIQAVTGAVSHGACASVQLNHPKPLGLSQASSGKYAKELQLLLHVLLHAQAGCPESVCQAIESFGAGAQTAHGKKAWLKVAAGSKGDLLVAVATALPPGSKHILEVGTYCGYSAVRMAAATSCK
eukprot:6485353-Amphidinium_carterae.1